MHEDINLHTYNFARRSLLHKYAFAQADSFARVEFFLCLILIIIFTNLPLTLLPANKEFFVGFFLLLYTFLLLFRYHCYPYSNPKARPVIFFCIITFISYGFIFTFTITVIPNIYPSLYFLLLLFFLFFIGYCYLFSCKKYPLCKTYLWCKFVFMQFSPLVQFSNLVQFWHVSP